MENNDENSNLVRGKTLCFILLLISLIVNSISRLLWLILEKGVGNIILNSCGIAFAICPGMILYVYISYFYEKRKFAILIAVALFSAALANLVEYIRFGDSGDIVVALLYIIIGIASVIFLYVNPVKYSFVIILFIILTVNVALMVRDVVVTDRVRMYNIAYMYFYADNIDARLLQANMATLFGDISRLFFICTVIIFGIKNPIPNLSNFGKGRKNNYAEEFTILKDKLDVGIISEEEYKKAREKIIDKL